MMKPVKTNATTSTNLAKSTNVTSAYSFSSGQKGQNCFPFHRQQAEKPKVGQQQPFLSKAINSLSEEEEEEDRGTFSSKSSSEDNYSADTRGSPSPVKFSFRFKDTETYKRIAMASSLTSSSASQGSSTSTGLPSTNKSAMAKVSHSMTSQVDLYDNSKRLWEHSSPFSFTNSHKHHSTITQDGYKGSSKVNKDASIRNTQVLQKPMAISTGAGMRSTEQQLPKKSKLTFQQLRQEMPNLLSVYDQDSSVVGLESAGKRSSSAAAPTTDNIFLRKYDPIKLLARLKASCAAIAAGKEEPRKILDCHTGPPSSIDKSARKRTVNYRKESTDEQRQEVSITPALPPNYKHHPNCSLGKVAGSIMVKRKLPIPRFAEPYRRRILRYACNCVPGISQKKLRLMAALHLKRAISRSKKIAAARRQGRSIEDLKSKPSDYAYDGPLEGVDNTSIIGNNNYSSFVTVTLPPLQVPKRKEWVIEENPLTIHTIKLLEHKREIQDRLEILNTEGIIYRLSPHPKMEERPFDTSYTYETIPLTPKGTKEILTHRILVLACVGGFTHARVRPLEILADAVTDFFIKMADRLKNIAEMEITGGGVDHGFPDPMERILVELGMGGARGLEEFYKERVIGYHHRMEEQCHALRREFAIKVRSINGGMNNFPSSNTSDITTNAAIGIGSGVTSTTTGTPSRSNAISASSAGSISTPNTPSSSIPLSPGNSVLAEILSNPEESPENTTSPMPASQQALKLNGMESQTEWTRAPPPNVVIRPNNKQHPQLLTLQSYNNSPTTVSSIKSMQPSLTQLLQRPVNISHHQQIVGKKPPGYSAHHQQIGALPQHFQPNTQFHQSQVHVVASGGHSLTVGSPLGSPQQIPGVLNESTQVLSVPMHMNDPGMGSTPPSPLTRENQAATQILIDSAFKGNPGIRGNTNMPNLGSPVSQNVNYERQRVQPSIRHLGTIVVNSGGGSNGSPSVTQHHNPQQSNPIRLNLGSISQVDGNIFQMNGSGLMSSETVSSANFPPSIKIKEAQPGSQRNNLLRLNFEQVPSSGADSTVLLSSSSPANQTDQSNDSSFLPIQFF